MANLSRFKNPQNSLAKMQNKVSDALEKKSKKTWGEDPDPRYWKPTQNDKGAGQAKIRFLPGLDAEDLQFVELRNHSFKGPGGYYIENCLTTPSIGKKDPAQQRYHELWKAGEEDKARTRKYRSFFISNILVMDDPANPENNGKVMLFKYGRSIMNMLNEKMVPPFDDVEPMNPFDPLHGATLHLRFKVDQKNKQRTYIDSTFLEPSRIAKKDSEIEEILDQQHSLSAEVGPDKFKTYEELKERLNQVENAEEPVVEERPKTAPKKLPTKGKVIEDTTDDEDIDLEDQIDKILE